MRYLYTIWLGIAMFIVGYNFTTWQFYFVIIPTICFVTLSIFTEK